MEITNRYAAFNPPPLETKSVDATEPSNGVNFKGVFRKRSLRLATSEIDVAERMIEKYVPLSMRSKPPEKDTEPAEPTPFPPIGTIVPVITEGTCHTVAMILMAQMPGVDDPLTFEEVITLSEVAPTVYEAILDAVTSLNLPKVETPSTGTGNSSQSPAPSEG